LNDKENPLRYFAPTYLTYFDDPELWELIRDAAEKNPDRFVKQEAQEQLVKREGG
jgi:hypothetical protein